MPDSGGDIGHPNCFHRRCRSHLSRTRRCVRERSGDVVALPRPGLAPTQAGSHVRLDRSRGLRALGSSTIVDDTVAALWLPAGTTLGDDVLNPLIDKLGRGARRRPRATRHARRHVREVHPSDIDHWYLLAIGVRQSRQGVGRGGTPLEHTLRLADERHQPAYLEASSPRSRALSSGTASRRR